MHAKKILLQFKIAIVLRLLRVFFLRLLRLKANAAIPTDLSDNIHTFYSASSVRLLREEHFSSFKQEKHFITVDKRNNDRDISFDRFIRSPLRCSINLAVT
jgi:hypothetical protein